MVLNEEQLGEINKSVCRCTPISAFLHSFFWFYFTNFHYFEFLLQKKNLHNVKNLISVNPNISTKIFFDNYIEWVNFHQKLRASSFRAYNLKFIFIGSKMTKFVYAFKGWNRVYPFNVGDLTISGLIVYLR